MPSDTILIFAFAAEITESIPKHTGRNIVKNAENISEQTAGFIVPIIDEKALLFLYLVYAYVIIPINTHDGRTHPTVAAREPAIPPTVYPVNEAALSAIGPGVNSERVITSHSCSLVIQAICFMTSSFINDNVLYPPPKLRAPIIIKVTNSLMYTMLFLCPRNYR